MELSYKLEHFEGPLDLLLHLIEKNKVDIYDIPIIEITEQYLEYVRKLEHEDLDLVSDFLVMAATLLEIKARMLLPREVDEDGEELDPRAELVARLLEYKKYKYMGQLLAAGEDAAAQYFFKKPSLPPEVKNYVPPIDLDELLQGVSLERLRAIFNEVLRRQDEKVDRVRSGFGLIHREKISLESRIGAVLNYARQHRRFSFRHMLESASSRMEVVVSFLAVLELMKMGRINLMQEAPFADMEIEILEKEGEETQLDLSSVVDA